MGAPFLQLSRLYIEGTNWPALEGLLDASVSMLPRADHGLASAAPRLDQVHDLDANPNQDDLTGYLSPSSLSSRESLATTFSP
ncbi:hypothetical protein N7471_012879 [Penicillium samsonianum]|uniref:uncharacterized protein n=1 Tax=Penicillium samsonianum TaxID=1882272 RepID=UPI002549796E|nr:uncharacterized protein N7471_012879 [Penicillium samsonianum]KAJ6125562.1 hypothetical protein N7471_012879 [Penicillium samsonianum]